MNTVQLNNAIHRLRYDIYLDDPQGQAARRADIEHVSHELGLAEDTIDRLVGALATEVNGPTFMGEPASPRHADPADCSAVMTAPYERWVVNNWNRRRADHAPNPLRDLFIMGLGIGGEAGEVQELLKKMVRDGREIRDDLRLELGDVLHYLTRIATHFDMTLPEIMAANRAKIDRRQARRESAAMPAQPAGQGPV